MASDESPTGDDRPSSTPTDREVEALHEVELGLEWLQRAQGYLLEFHHATGHAMDHLRDAERGLRAAGHDDAADAIRDDLLPRGVVDDHRWSYDVVEDFQETMLAETSALERWVRRDLVDGRRHVRERRQERSWKRRSETDAHTFE